MASENDAVKKAMIVDARARNISPNVRCTECGSQYIEDSQADIAILLRKVFFYALLPSGTGVLIHDEIGAGKSDKEIYKKLEDDFGETVLIAVAATGGWAYKKHKQKTNVHIMVLDLVRGVLLTLKEKQTMIDILTLPPSQGARTPFWWRR
ncbi:Cytochrome c-type biogenesis CcmH-like mitochondrial protein [Vigna angularis]|uniref:Cytochrome c-type biogenesis protein n=1 Tax=Phaseolus angularis TaxID=3914 RepID=A0A8T0JTT1_PHAAN|nr:Cytochrome c-type biogenesis CcmH-like mitochondrial protein [Vigna angularis]